MFHVKPWQRKDLSEAMIMGAWGIELYDALPPVVRDAYKDYHPADTLDEKDAARSLLDGAPPEWIAAEIRAAGEASQGKPVVARKKNVSRETE